MRLLLDEMWSNEIAAQLRSRGHDVIAVTEPEHQSRYGQVDDAVVIERAQEDGRAIVTENVADYERARLELEHRGKPHYGLIYTHQSQFNRNLGARVIGPMVRALDRLLSEHPENDPRSLLVYLRRAD